MSEEKSNEDNVDFRHIIESFMSETKYDFRSI